MENELIAALRQTIAVQAELIRTLQNQLQSQAPTPPQPGITVTPFAPMTTYPNGVGLPGSYYSPLPYTTTVTSVSDGSNNIALTGPGLPPGFVQFNPHGDQATGR